MKFAGLSFVLLLMLAASASLLQFSQNPEEYYKMLIEPVTEYNFIHAEVDALGATILMREGYGSRLNDALIFLRNLTTMPRTAPPGVQSQTLEKFKEAIFVRINSFKQVLKQLQ